MKCNIYLFPTLIFTFLFVIGCKKEAEEVNNAVWQQVLSINNESKIILNASTDGNQLFTYGPYNLNITDNHLITKSIIHGANSINVPPASSNIFGYFFEDRNLFFVTSYKALQNGLHATALSVGEVSPNAKSFNITNLSHRYLWAINDQGQVLVSVKEHDDRYGIYLINFAMVDGNGAVGHPVIIKKVAVAPLLNSPTSFYFLKDRFFFFTNENGIGTIYTIDKKGNVAATNAAFDGELLIYKDIFYLVHGREIILSKDDGLSFTERFTYNQDLSSYYFRVIKDKVFVFNPRAGIGTFDFTPSGFQISGIDMTGLQGNHITQLTLFDEKLFVSTLTGLYYKNWRDILK